MRRLWIGLALLAVILSGSVWEMMRFDRVYGPAAQRMEQAGVLAEQSLNAAEAQVQDVRKVWEKEKFLTEVFDPHEAVQQIDRLFAQLERNRDLQDTESYAENCAAVSAMLEALSRSRSPTWWNFL